MTLTYGFKTKEDRDWVIKLLDINNVKPMDILEDKFNFVHKSSDVKYVLHITAKDDGSMMPESYTIEDIEE